MCYNQDMAITEIELEQYTSTLKKFTEGKTRLTKFKLTFWHDCGIIMA